MTVIDPMGGKPSPSLETMLLAKGVPPDVARITGLGQIVRALIPGDAISDADLFAAVLYLATQRYGVNISTASGQKQHTETAVVLFFTAKVLYQYQAQAANAHHESTTHESESAPLPVGRAYYATTGEVKSAAGVPSPSLSRPSSDETGQGEPEISQASPTHHSDDEVPK
ncbi:MAG TPA: hypothetical protein VLC46_16560 [Thermoanaerobaculia bacterium]|jgi:hypothetical protein|nr:hypothetical protein [Thermoanaerobaculia bacterium]